MKLLNYLFWNLRVILCNLLNSRLFTSRYVDCGCGYVFEQEYKIFGIKQNVLFVFKERFSFGCGKNRC